MQHKSLSVLLVDDDSDDIFFLQTAFQRCNLTLSQIHIAYNGEQAMETLQLCRRKQILPDLIFLDWNMPIMDGRDVLTALNQVPEFAAIPVILLSTSNRPSDIREAYSLGSSSFITKPSSFITKPSSFDELVNLVSAIHDHWRATGQVARGAHELRDRI